MQTGKAIILAAVILAGAGAATAWAIQPRYSLTNPRANFTVRLNRTSGDMIGCEGLTCQPMMKGDKVVKIELNGPIPPPPPGYKLDTSYRPARP